MSALCHYECCAEQPAEPPVDEASEALETRPMLGRQASPRSSAPHFNLWGRISGALCCLGVTLLLLVLAVLASVVACQLEPPEQSQALPLVDKYLGGKATFTYADMPVQRDPAMLEALRQELTPYTDRVGKHLKKGASQFTWGSADAPTMVRALYTATRVRGVFEQAPEPLRGVFWMRGDGAPEELVVIQYGRWFPEEGIWAVPMAPFMWSWTLERPDEAPAAGLLYSPGIAADFAEGSVASSATVTWRFNGAMTFGQMMTHPGGDLRVNAPPAALSKLPLVTVDFAMQDISLPEQKRGTLWWRSVKWGLSSCNWVEIGSYQLTKIWDANGAPVEPYYTEFVRYMGNKSLFTWTGYQNTTGLTS